MEGQGSRSLQRTVYVTAADQTGASVTELAATDLLVKEGGQERQVLAVEPSRARLRVALAVEELLTPDNDVRIAIASFIDRVRASGEAALYVVGKRTERRVDYTAEAMPFAMAINRFPARGVDQGNLVESLREIARSQRSLEGRHAIVAVANEAAQISSVTAEGVLEQLKAGRSVLYAATLATFDAGPPQGATSGGRRLDLEAQVSGLERDRVFGEGTRQSGGLHLTSARPGGLRAVLDRMAEELQHQFVVTYAMPPGFRSDGIVSVEATRKGLVVRGPTRVPES